MLSSAAAANIVASLTHLKLEPVIFLRVCAALAPVFADDTKPSPDATPQKLNGTALPAKGSGTDKPPPKSAPPAKLRRRGNPRSVDRSGKLFAEARRLLDEEPELSVTELAERTGCSWPTAKRARAAFNQAREAETQDEAPEQPAEQAGAPQPAERASERPSPVEPPAVVFLRQALREGPVAAGDIEEAAEQKGLGSKQLERARTALGITVQRLPGRGICYGLPSQPDAAAEA